MRTLLLSILLLISGSAHALSFTPNAFEWATWPEYCRARYTVSGAGLDSKFASMVPKAKVEEWARKLDGVWAGFHHYCAGVIVFERARRATEERFRLHYYEQVVGECNYTIERSAKTHPMYAKMLTLRGRALHEIGKAQEGFGDFKLAVHLHPTISDPYAAWALILRRHGERAKARQILEDGIAATNGGNAEMHYLLGLVLAELEDYEPAMKHAKSAYELGYPLPGLKRKLKDAGHWRD